MIYDRELPEFAGQPVDQKLVLLAKHLEGKVVTNDYNLNKVAKLHNVGVINLNDIANSLKPVFLPGEALEVRIVKAGEEAGPGRRLPGRRHDGRHRRRPRARRRGGEDRRHQRAANERRPHGLRESERLGAGAIFRTRIQNQADRLAVIWILALDPWFFIFRATRWGQICHDRLKLLPQLVVVGDRFLAGRFDVVHHDLFRGEELGRDVGHFAGDLDGMFVTPLASPCSRSPWLTIKPPTRTGRPRCSMWQ